MRFCEALRADGAAWRPTRVRPVSAMETSEAAASIIAIVA
jgi:hypothetical protein